MARLKWTTEQRRVIDLIPTDYNPRERDERGQSKLVASINKFDLVEIPVINRDNHIVAGQRRWEVYMESGRENDYIDVRVPNRMLTKDEVDEYILISNTHAGKWSLPKLEAHFSNIYKDIVDLPSIAVDLPSSDMLDKKKSDQKEVVEDEFSDESVENPVTQTGDIYELNSHRFICADSTDILELKRLMSGKLAQMVFTDPPYNVRVRDIVGLGKTKHDEFQMASGEMNKTRFSRFLEDCFLNHTTKRHWKIVSDASLSGNDTFELVSPILIGESGINELKTVCRVLNECGAKVNKSCGTHVHFDAAGFNLDIWKRIYVNYFRLENTIDGFMPRSRRENTYCKGLRNITNFESKINGCLNLNEIASVFGSSRYFKINPVSYSRHNTCEFRQHSGTVEFEKIENWIKFLNNLVEYSKSNLVTDKTLNGLQNFNDNEIVDYLKTRTLKLA